MTVWSWKCGGCGEIWLIEGLHGFVPRPAVCGCGSFAWSLPAQTDTYADAHEAWRLMDARVAEIASTVTIPEGM